MAHSHYCCCVVGADALRLPLLQTRCRVHPRSVRISTTALPFSKERKRTLSHTLLSMCVCAGGQWWPTLCAQRPCQQCGKLYTVKAGEKHRLCKACNNERRHPAAAAAAL